MKYTLVVKPSVTAEASTIHAHREREKKGSGDRFVEALVDRYARIKADPNLFQVRKGDYRHALLHRLKYRVVFKVKGGTIYIVQVRHTSRDPSKKFGP